MLGAELVERQKLVEPQNKIEHNQADNGPKQNHFLHDGVSYCLWPNRCTAADTADGNERLLYVIAYRTARIYRKHGYIAGIKKRAANYPSAPPQLLACTAVSPYQSSDTRISPPFRTCQIRSLIWRLLPCGRGNFSISMKSQS